jgi:hypothetical protein
MCCLGNFRCQFDLKLCVYVSYMNYLVFCCHYTSRWLTWFHWNRNFFVGLLIDFQILRRVRMAWGMVFNWELLADILYTLQFQSHYQTWKDVNLKCTHVHVLVNRGHQLPSGSCHWTVWLETSQQCIYISLFTNITTMYTQQFIHKHHNNVYTAVYSQTSQQCIYSSLFTNITTMYIQQFIHKHHNNVYTAVYSQTSQQCIHSSLFADITTMYTQQFIHRNNLH